MSDEPTFEKPSRKELARQLRREAYVRQKAQRAADPRVIALKEVAKQRRKEAYQAAKARRKADPKKGGRE